ncbi:hypothetical protein C6Q22_06575 [Burkholderia multivorans]|nr:hypothetical protein C6P92_06615 [Burkholderia multivorans]PRF25794.1 hypothetical protein C6Q03_08435 [Burkholderia multivorans]PRF92456.1 hypothetical protein C6Q22_06575 [Burkholderia multivorans]PRF98668.1 hypothetical protein C6Q21_28245 [Burkholderia multivorans]PRG18998.1 hypothetical protein C6T62_27720 [Burkholderia multivorans]
MLAAANVNRTDARALNAAAFPYAHRGFYGARHAACAHRRSTEQGVAGGPHAALQRNGRLTTFARAII